MGTSDWLFPVQLTGCQSALPDCTFPTVEPDRQNHGRASVWRERSRSGLPAVQSGTARTNQQDYELREQKGKEIEKHVGNGPNLQLLHWSPYNNNNINNYNDYYDNNYNNNNDNNCIWKCFTCTCKHTDIQQITLHGISHSGKEKLHYLRKKP